VSTTVEAPTGLTQAEAVRRLKQWGPNLLPATPPEPAWQRFLRQFASPLIAILVVALAVDLLLWLRHGREALPLEAAAIGAILLLNAGLGYWQERKAEAALEALEALVIPLVWTVRDGHLEHIPSPALVPGDVIRLDAGDRVPADARLSVGTDLQFDEAVLTGESLPVAREPGEEIHSGTLLVRGQGWAEVLRTGARSAMGQIATMLGTVRQAPTPLQRRLERFGKRVALLVVLLAGSLALAGLLSEGLVGFGHFFLVAVALAVAAVPEGLPAAVTFALALGVERMARRRAVVRRMDAVEALGSVTVIATDKTGTLTENRMDVRQLRTGDEPRALRAMVLANDADDRTGAGDPLEIALLQFARTRAVNPAALLERLPRIDSRPFDSAWQFMRVTVDEDGGPVSYLKGAPEVIVARCQGSEKDRAAWLAEAAAAGQEGMRAVALAWSPGTVERDLHWLGLVFLWDPPRPEAAEAIQRCRSAGVRVVMLTGDHAATAAAVARALGLPDQPLQEGAMLRPMSPTALQSVVRDTSVFARVTPGDKLRIVEALQAGGEIVAVTGDGVNDAPALKRADIGIAMGRRGSAVSREVADLVLLDDHFATIVAAIEEGRSIFQNIRKFLRFLFSTNLSEVLVVSGGLVAALWLGLRDSGGMLLLPLTAAQLLWINLVTDGAPALALALDRNPGVMHRPPRPPSEALLDRASTRFILSTGALKALVAMALLLVLPRLGEPVEAVRTVVFLFMAAGQVLFAYPSRHAGGAQSGNRALHTAVLLTLLIQPAVVLVPALRDAFDTVMPGPIGWQLLGGAILLVWLMAEAVGRLTLRRP
jgi:Ca2+-transporting ATPase